MADATLTRRKLVTGIRDQKTGWLRKSYEEEDVEGCILHQGVPVPNALAREGLYAKYPHDALIPDVIHEDDEVIDKNGDYYVVLATAERWHLDLFDGYHNQVEKIKEDRHADRPATSGTWHLDSDSLVTDVRYRTKLWLQTYVADVYEDNGATVADNVVMFAKPDYHLWREFWDTGTDVIAYVESASCRALSTYDHYPYAWDETVTIRVCAVDKAGITGARLVSDYSKAVSTVASDHPVGSIRELTASVPSHADLGGMVLYSQTVTLRYKRANDDYTPSYPRITWGPSAAPTGTFIFPNVIELSPPLQTDDSWIKPRRFIGNLVQVEGSKSIDYRMKCDLDMQPWSGDVSDTKISWKRPQTTNPKSDKVNYEIFLDLLHNEGINQDYHTLTLSADGPAHSVRLVSVEPNLTGDGNTVTLVFREYRSTSASGSTYKQRFGISA